MVAGVRAIAPHPVPPFHRRWIRATYAPDTVISALSVPRGSAKTYIMGMMAGLAIRPGSPTYERGIEVLGVSASLEQSRVMLAFVREALRDCLDDYRWKDSSQRLAVTRKACGTRLRILSSSAKRAMGLAQFSTVFADEPGSWENRGGTLMFHALRQSAGKRPGQRLVIAGTRAPSVRGNWWPGLLDAGSGDGIHVTELSPAEGDPWDAWPTIRRCNPMVLHNATLRKAILRERDQARRDETLRSAFRAYRLNEQIDTFNSVLVGAETWRRVEARAVPPREGRPVVGLDLGSERSWSAAWALWRNGRSECYAVCPGVPDLSERERQDAMPRGLYRRLAADGVLLVDEGLRVSRPATLIDHLVSVGIRPAVMLCDRFLIASLKDEVRGRWPLVPRVTRWSEATEDISAFRRLAADGPLSVAPQCQGLARVSLSEASVVSDDQGSCRLEKKRNRRSRDDVAVAGTLAAGAIARELRRPAPRPRRFAVVSGR